MLALAAVSGPHASALADGGTCLVTVTRELPTGDNAGVDDIPIASMEGTPDEQVDVTALFKAEHECEHFCPEAILEKESLEWSVISATLAPFAIPPAAQPQPVDVAAKFKVAPIADKHTTLKGTALDQIGDYTVTVKAKATCEYGKKETAEDEETITVVFHVYTVFLGVHLANFNQDDDFVMLRDRVGETLVEREKGKVIIDKHEDIYPFKEKCFATVLGNPVVVPIKTALAEPTNHYSFAGLDEPGKTIDVPQFPKWKEYAIRGEKLDKMTKVGDVQQEGTFADKKAKDKGTVFGFEGTLKVNGFGTYETMRHKNIQWIDVPAFGKNVGFRVHCAARTIPDGICGAPQLEHWSIGYVQNATLLSILVRYLPDKASAEFKKEVKPKTEFTIPDHIEFPLTLPGAMRDHRKRHTQLYQAKHAIPLNCRDGEPADVFDTPIISDFIIESRTFPTEAPAPLIPKALKIGYAIDVQTYSLDLVGWCVAFHPSAPIFVPLQQVAIKLRLDSKAEGVTAVIPPGGEPADAKTPPITDGDVLNEWLKANDPPVAQDGPANTVITKP